MYENLGVLANIRQILYMVRWFMSNLHNETPFQAYTQTQVVTDLQVVTRLLSSRYQDVFALLVPSCCDKSGTKFLSPCYKVDDGNRLATSCSNNTNTGCS